MDDREAYCALLRREPSFFLAHCFSVLGGEGEFQDNWHIHAMLHELDLLERGDNRRLIIAMPPRHLKSMTVSIVWAARTLLRNPAIRIISICYGSELAEKQGRDCLRVLDDPMVRRAYPEFRFARRSATDFETDLGGGRLSTSLGGVLTGRGADVILVDDPTKSKDAASQAVRESDKAWLLNTAMSRQNDPRACRIAVVMQRLHEGDLVGVLKEMGGWKELCLPAIAQEDERIQIGPDRFYQRRAGHPLHPARQPLWVLEQQKREMGSANFAAQYLQSPLPAEGNLVRAEWIQTYGSAFDPRTALGQRIMSIDTASKDGLTNDYTAIVIAHLRGKEVRIVEVFRRRLQFPDLKRHVVRLIREWQVTEVLIEDQGSGTALLQELRSDQTPGIPWPLRVKPEGDKASRLAGVTGMIEAGQLLLPEDASWLAEFKAELLGFPNAKHDDQVDALSQLLSWVRREWIYSGSTTVGAPIYGDAEV